MDHAHHFGGEPGRDRGPAQQRGAQLGGGGVVGVRLDDHRTAGGERARGVSAGYGEGEREVGGGVDRDHAQRDLVAAQFGARGAEGGVGAVDPDVEVGPGVHGVGEGAQLAGGAGQFAGEPARAERGLGVGGLDHVRGGLVQQRGGGAQEGGAHGGVGERATGGVGGPYGFVHLAGCGLHRNLFALLPGAGVHTPDWCRCHGPLPPGSFSILNAVPVDE